MQRMNQVVMSAVLILGFGQMQTEAATPSKMEAEVVVLRTGGFMPPKLQRPTGPFLLVVRNQTPLDKFTIQAKVAGTTDAIPLKDVSKEEQFVLDLPVGTYTVTDTTHPNWVPLQITIR